MQRCLHLMLASFLMLMSLFYLSEFTIHSSIPGRSTEALFSNISGLKIPRKVILVIVDSLRYDYLPKFSFIQTTLKRSPSKSFIAKCQVANPTMTTQRIQALMTGSEIFSSTNILKAFFASKTSTDNIIDQLNAQKKQSFILGDDTWIKLFSFSGSQTCSNTYNVHDYDTCDRPIYQSMIQKMSGDMSYHLLISHFLSLDHIGHSKGNIQNDEMEAKIRKISSYMERVIEAMDNDTILFVSGDHGMRQDGNHGGSSQQQVQTFLYGYNKLIDFSGIQSGKGINQSDITTTLALYLNIPLPLNAFGVPIIQALPKDIVNNEYIEEINKNLLNHFQTMTQFYTGESQILQLSQKDMQSSQSVQQKLEIIRSKLQFLKYSAPNEAINKLILILLSTVSLIIALQVLQINKLFETKKKVVLIFLSILNKSILAFMLFVSFFSWYLIKNLSNAFLVFFIMSIIILYIQRKIDLFSKIQQNSFTLFLIIFLLCQIQPQKTSQFQSNFIRFQNLNELLKHIIVKILIISILFYRSSQYLAAFSQKRLKILVISILCLTHLNYVLTFCLSIQIYFIRTAIFLLGLLSTIYSIKHKKSNILHFIVFSSMILLFLGQNGPIILIVCYNITKILAQLHVSSIYFGYLSQMVWWFSGNRFEYSGIDVVKSYIFDSNYHPLLNGICIIIILISPQLIFFVYSILMSKNQKKYRQICSNESLQLQERESDTPNKTYDNPYQFLLVSLLALLSSAWNLDYNNSKILFTIIYLPLLLFCLIKYVLLYLMLLLTNFIMKNDPRI